MNRIDEIRQLRGYERIGLISCSRLLNMSSVSPVMDNDDILGTIFAPDPVTGIPRSDLAIVLSKCSAPEISQYIRDQLMRPVDTGVSCDDAQLALDMTMTKKDSFESYASRLKELSKIDENG